MYQYLNKILPSSEIEKLLSCVHNNEVYFYNQETVALRELQETGYLSSLDSLLSEWKQEVDVHLLDLKDEASTKKVESNTAKEYFSDGMGLLFNDINLHDDYFQESLRGLSADLGVSNLTMSRNLIYATPGGGGTETHFDQNINLIIQVHGEKSWWIKENETIVNPLSRYTLGTQPDPELCSYLEGPFPESVDYDDEYILKPGSILFVPRGHWHKTHAHSDALALNFTFSIPSWTDMISMALRARVIQSDLWRESVLGLNNSEIAKKKTDNFQMLIDSLKEDIQSWKAEDILGFIEYSGEEGE
ncbi:JmjC domain-containing protein [Halobacteriovorax sp.]|uniref:JmjC domain-containing protein n=1 Tax=Halobacteriovorax sp. TaxID=2020862 RepID=UPI0035656345